MSEYDLHHQEAIAQQEQQPSQPHWKEVNINGEQFLVMKDLVAPLVTDQNEKPVPFTYDEYRHVESGMQIQVWKLGMDKPQDHPAPARLDYGCPCMQVGTAFHLMGHDCAQQREIMFQTIADLGIGAIATISEQTAAGNGHGSHAVLQQSTMQYEDLVEGRPIRSMHEAYTEMGYYDDVRRHNIASSALAHSIGSERPIIATTSNPDKIGELKSAGLDVIDGIRVELVTPSKSKQSRELESRRRSSKYIEESGISEPGAYLAVDVQGKPPVHVRLTPEIYQGSLLPAAQSIRRNVGTRRPN